MSLRSYVFYGQGGRSTSAGMDLLAASLRDLGPTTTHSWYENVASDVGAQLGPVALIGFSLGGNQLGWLGPQFPRRVTLGVAMDPSRQSPLCQRVGSRWVQRAVNYDRFVCFYNPGTWIFGGSAYLGAEEITISMPHLMVPLSVSLRQSVLALAREASAS